MTLLWIDGAEVLDDLEAAASSLGDVHVQAQVVLAGSHCCSAAWPLVDPCVVEGGDHVLLCQRAGLCHRSGPQPESSVEARACAAAGEFRGARIERVVPLEQLAAERVGDGLVVVEAAVE